MCPKTRESVLIGLKEANSLLSLLTNLLQQTVLAHLGQPGVAPLDLADQAPECR